MLARTHNDVNYACMWQVRGTACRVTVLHIAIPSVLSTVVLTPTAVLRGTTFHASMHLCTYIYLPTKLLT